MKELDLSIDTTQLPEEKLLQKLESSLKNLRIADVELFITAAHMKNLGKSASFHHLSQSATSTAIQRVEAAFGVSLCTHEKRQFRLTREGQILASAQKLEIRTPEGPPLSQFLGHCVFHIFHNKTPSTV